MRKIAVLLLALAVPAYAGSHLALAQKQYDLGEKALAKVARHKADSKRLKALKATEPSFARALKKARKGLEHAGAKDIPALQQLEHKATVRLVGVLNAETILYLERGSMSNARKANAAALKLVPGDAKAKDLAGKLDDPPDDEILAGYSAESFDQAAALRDLLRNRSQIQRRHSSRRPAPR